MADRRRPRTSASQTRNVKDPRRSSGSFGANRRAGMGRVPPTRISPAAAASRRFADVRQESRPPALSRTASAIMTSGETPLQSADAVTDGQRASFRTSTPAAGCHVGERHSHNALRNVIS